MAFTAGRVPRRGPAQHPKLFLSLVEGDAQSPVVGATAATLPKVRVTTGPGGTGSAVRGVVVVWTTTDDSRVSSGGAFAASAVSTTDASGYAVINWRMGAAIGPYALSAVIRGGPPGASPVVFGATAIAGSLAHLVAISAQSQSGTIASAVADPPIVQATDTLGNPIAGQSVAGAIVSGGGSGTSLSGTTDANGLFSVGSWTLGSAVGANTLTLTAGAFTVTFTATSAAGASTQLAKISGDTQSAVVNTGLALPLIVEARDAGNQPVSGEPVTFRQVGPGTLDTSVVVNTDVNGRAQFTPTLDTKMGTNTITATILGGSVAQIFTATGTVGAAAKLAFVAQPPSNGTSGSDLPGTATVELTDAFGNRRTGDSSSVVTLAVNSGAATLPSTTAVATAGLASFPTIVLTGAGSVVLSAASGVLQVGLSNAILLAPPVAAVFVFGVQPSTVIAGQTIAPAIVVRVEDGGGTLISSDNGRPVTLTISTNPGGSTLGGTVTRSTVNGLATFSDITLDLTSNNYKLTAGDGVLTSAVSNFFNVIAAGTIYVSQPAGHTTIHEFFHDKTNAQLGTNTMHAVAGVTGMTYVSGNYHNLHTEQGIDDTEAPFGVTQVGRTRYSNGTTYNGTAPDNLGMWNAAARINFFAIELYICHIFKIVGDGTAFENNAGGCKWGFWHSGSATDNAINLLWLNNNGSGTQTRETQWKFLFKQQGGANNVMGQINRSQNNGFSGNFRLRLGTYHRVEVVAGMNTLGAVAQQANGTYLADGTIDIHVSDWTGSAWTSPDHVMTYNNVCYKRTGANTDKGFGFAYWNPTFGGGSTIPLSQNNDIYHARWFVSGK